MNKLGDRVTIIKKVASNQTGHERFIKYDISEYSHISVDGSSKTSRVPSIRLDTFCKERKIKTIDAVKIDVEGAELEVLIGGKRTINESKPSILIEIEERHRQGSTKLVPEFLKKSGYDGFYFSNEKLFQIDTFLIEEHQWKKELPGQKHPEGKHYINNFIFIHKDNERAIKELKTSTK